MRSTLYIRSGFFYTEHGHNVHMYYNGTVTKDTTWVSIQTHINMANMHGDLIKILETSDSNVESLDQFIIDSRRILEEEMDKVACHDFVNIILDSTYTIKLRNEVKEVLIEILNRTISCSRSTHTNPAMIT